MIPSKTGRVTAGALLFFHALVFIFQFKEIHQAAGEQIGVARVLHFPLAQHLPDHNFNMLVVDLTPWDW